MRSRTYKNIRRLHQIVAILIKYGFGGLVRELRVFPFIATVERFLFFRRYRERRILTIPQRIRMTLEELGPTFVKLGQVASTRADLLPLDWVEEFKKLQDMVPPLPFQEVREVIERSLKAPLSQRFATFEETPCASASIAQVHYATLPDGQEVAVKVKRPRIEKVIEADISVMYILAYLLDRYVPPARRYRPKEVVDEFNRVIHKELDLAIEGANISQFHKIFEGDPTVQIPMVFWDYTTSDVLIMERVYGTPIDEVDKIKAQGLDIKKIAENGIRAFFKQVFEFGFFHADLHPGNIFARRDGAIIYLDFGIVGRLDDELRHYLAHILFYLVRQDYRGMAMVHREMGLISKDVDIYEFEDTLRQIAEPIFGRPLEKIDVSELLLRLIRTARRFNMKLQPNLLLLQKSMVIIEGVGRQLYPDINMWEIVRPLIYRWMIKEKASPRRLYERGKRGVEGIVEVASSVPYQVHSLLERTLKEELRIGFIHHRLESLEKGLETLGTRIAMGMVIAGLLVGSAFMTISWKGGPTLLGVPAIGGIGFLIAIFLGVVLGISILRGR